MTKRLAKATNQNLVCPLGELGEALRAASNFYRRRNDANSHDRERTAWTLANTYGWDVIDWSMTSTLVTWNDDAGLLSEQCTS